MQVHIKAEVCNFLDVKILSPNSVQTTAGQLQQVDFQETCQHWNSVVLSEHVSVCFSDLSFLTQQHWLQQ